MRLYSEFSSNPQIRNWTFISWLLTLTCFVVMEAGAQDKSPSVIRFNPLDSTELVYIPSGEFIMGSDSAELAQIWKKFDWNPEELDFTRSERPAHRVRLDGFWMYSTLVSVAQYRAFAQSKNFSLPEPPSYGWKDDNPIVNVTWEEASFYCECQGGRLPTEAEWEYAARAGNTGLRGNPRTVFTWGDQLPSTSIANLADKTFLESRYYDHPNFHGFDQYSDGYATASPAKAYPPNAFGLYDMAGNVLEWCDDWYSESYPTDSLSINPKGPEAGTRKVLRGGAFDTTPTITRIARRLGNYPSIKHEEKGFRCVFSGTLSNLY
ncbi:SUMF1/EgtB/PvdO family nonheme iron enzyme [Algoriphagus aestuariicola]|uniref:SUMF1/EgtB/PvdO family nonheme iron enzyme n=1 Tax=Algoriphagus aestuariicola TaxID=1852016 RepID=A0ABS3BL25_9BACT|nr:SUMF1/EgtB/PvdO family nonheme iron enzyme [Algoriphagus aestuariicola]MBN7799702.1 SUMF1/EgtB/PvdO family nonheme iron enzyme [Algoriphagus aestuariicola]